MLHSQASLAPFGGDLNAVYCSAIRLDANGVKPKNFSKVTFFKRKKFKVGIRPKHRKKDKVKVDLDVKKISCSTIWRRGSRGLKFDKNCKKIIVLRKCVSVIFIMLEQKKMQFSEKSRKKSIFRKKCKS